MTHFAWPIETSPQENIVYPDRGGAAPLQVLRDGAMQSPLFLAPGLKGDLVELARLAVRIETPQAVIALAFDAQDSNGLPLDNIERMAELFISAMRSVQPTGPYRVGGYSFGGLVAFEIANQLRGSGESLDVLILIDAILDERYWPRGEWLGALLRRTFWHLRRIAGMRSGDALRELRLRAAGLGKRLLRRVEAKDGKPGPAPTNPTSVGESSRRAMARYRPRHYDDVLTLICSKVDRHFGCQTANLWDGLANYVEVLVVPGDHLSIMQNPESLDVVAEAIGRRLEPRRPACPGMRPMPGFARPMLLSTMRWFSTARLAHSLVEAGFSVTSCRPAGHPLDLVDGTGGVDGAGGQFRLAWLFPLRSLRKALLEAAPDIILPDDEGAIALLRRLHDKVAGEDRALAALISRSLGGNESTQLDSRAATIAEARRLGIACPPTERIPGPEALVQWRAPFVLKVDGSSGGRGVAIVKAPEDIHRAWRILSGPPSFLQAAKRLLVDHDRDTLAAWLGRRRFIVNAQAYVEGNRQAIATAACMDGRTLDLVCLEVVHASEAQGPATVVRIIDHPGMAEAVKRIVERFQLSGFMGLDFLIDDQGVAQLIELNFRITPTCHFLVEGRAGGVVALFPQERIRDPHSTFKLDIPKNAQPLIEFATASIRKRTRARSRLLKRIGRLYAR